MQAQRQQYAFVGGISDNNALLSCYGLFFFFLFRFFYFMQLIKNQINMKTKKIRLFDNGNGLLVSVKDIVNYLESNGVVSGKKPMGIKWKFYTEVFDKLKYQYKLGTTSMQVNIFDFQDLFICWAELWLMKKYFTDLQKHKKPFQDLFRLLDSPHEIRNSDIFEYYEPFKKS